ncbi:MAG TPA: hypothetical protein VMW88_02685 [Thermoplasmata archaeon]|nr:hypothetical protein [Thermoplasmata archaeon]
MVDSEGIEEAVEEARWLLSKHGHDCRVTAMDVVRWFETDTVYDQNSGLDKVIVFPLLVVHELVEIENVKRMGLALTKDVIIRNPEKVDEAHLIAAGIELELAASMKDVKHLRWRLEHIRMWSEDPSVTPSNREKYKALLAKVTKTVEDLEEGETR